MGENARVINVEALLFALRKELAQAPGSRTLPPV
jgi:hypothetical protein